MEVVRVFVDGKVIARTNLCRTVVLVQFFLLLVALVIIRLYVVPVLELP